MRVQDIMQRDVKACSPHDSLDHVAGILWDLDLGAVPVVDEERKPIGMITDRDIAMAAYTRGICLADGEAESAMSRGTVTCSPGATVQEAERLMQDFQVRRVPVVDEEGKLVGVVSLADLAQSAAQAGRAGEAADVVRTLARICERRGAPPSQDLAAE